jgi:hypothetical protein
MNSGDSYKKKNKIALVILLIALVIFSRKAAEKSIHSDFERYYHAGEVVLEGGNIYEEKGHLQFKYFPVFAQLMSVAAHLPQNIAVFVWYAIVAGCFLGMVFISLKLSGVPPSKYIWMVVIILAVCGRYFTNNARNGQINIPVAFLAYLGIYLVFTGRDRLGGLSVALSACLKFMPVLFIFYFAWRRRWKAFAYSVLGVLFFVFIMPAVTFGFKSNINLLNNYIASRSKMITGVPKKDAPGESVPALLNRLLRDIPANSYHKRKDRSYSINIADLNVKAVSRIALCAVLIIFTLACANTYGHFSKSMLANSAYAGIFFILMLLISPEARNAHFITMVLPIALIAADVLEYRRIAKGKFFLGACFIFASCTSSGLIGEAGSSYMSAFSAAGIGAAIAWYCLRLIAKKEIEEINKSQPET